MRKILLLSLLSFSAMAEEKIIKIEAHINKMQIAKNNTYRLELKELAAVYHANEEFVPCLQISIKENKKVLLEVEAYTLQVKSCKVN